MATTEPAYEPDKTYTFVLMRKVRLSGMLLPVAARHEAKGAVLNAIIDQEGEDVIDTADAIE